MVCDDNFEWPYCIQYSQLCCIEMTKSVIKTYSKKLMVSFERGSIYNIC